jgi:HSP20 family protein
MQSRTQEQQIPLKVYKSEDRVTVAAPMPGLEPQDIDIEVTQGGEIVLKGELRGTLKGEKDVLIDEWNPGAYRRSYSLQSPVDAAAANATYENGVLTVSLPISAAPHPARIELERIGPTEGKRFGASGHAGEEPTQRNT